MSWTEVGGMLGVSGVTMVVWYGEEGGEVVNGLRGTGRCDGVLG